jgi:hypothetical protein
VVAAVSLGVRAIVLSEQLAANPMLREAVLDDAAYIAYARAFAVGETRTWFLAPLYPWLLACAGRAFELGLPLACWINALFGGATSAALALTARRAGWRAGCTRSWDPSCSWTSRPGRSPSCACCTSPRSRRP